MTLYYGFGLHLTSELDLPEMLPRNSEQPDAEIRIGKVPASLAEITGEGVLYQINPREFRLDIDDVARYFVRDGCEIIVEPYPNADKDEVRLVLLGSVLGVLLHQRHVVPLHASCIATPAGAVLFCGPSGTGKSTTAAAMRQRGYRMVADDISPITLDENEKPIVLPGYPQQKLWADTLLEFEESSEKYRRLRPELEKYAIPAHQEFFDEPLSLHSIYFLIPSATHDQVKIIPVQGLEKIDLLSDNIYHKRLLRQMGQDSNLTKPVLEIVMNARLMCVERPSTPFRLQELADTLEEHFSQ